MLNTPIKRRSLLLGSAATAFSFAIPKWPVRDAQANAEFRLSAAPGNAYFLGGPYPKTSVWCYNGAVPGPEIRVKRGDRLRVVVDNALDQATTVHWHGIRLPNNMDGVANLTQPPIEPGQSFTYEFELPDAGTYWYHPHHNSSEQIGRGLYGPLIIEEREPIQVDRELIWILDDWRLTESEQISDDFGQMSDKSHGGRLGNTATVNGWITPKVRIRSGERIRLRIINVANARNFAFKFPDHQPKVIAIDGHPVEPHDPAGGYIMLGAAMRIDLILDATESPGTQLALMDEFYRGREYKLLDLVYSDEPPLRENPLDTAIQLPANPLPEPDLEQAERFPIIFAGGAMGGLRGAILNGQQTDMRTLASQGLLWAINGEVIPEPLKQPLLTLKRGQSCVLALKNDTAFVHPIHLHGHAFRVLSRDGSPTTYREWQDTVLIMPDEQVDIAFVADNPGDWLFHCHILEHQASGMSGIIRVV